MQQQPSGLNGPTSGPQRGPKQKLEDIEKSKAAEFLDDAKNEAEEAFDAALLAAAEAACSPASLDAQRKSGEAAVAALQATLDAGDDDSTLAKAIAKKGKVKPSGKLAKALKKPTGTMALIGEGGVLDAISLGGFDLNDPAYVSLQCREGGCAAVSVKLAHSERALADDALAATIAEQETSRGEFPSPIPAFARGPIVDALQVASAAADGAMGVVVPFALNGAEGTAALMEEAEAYGLETLVRVCSEEELTGALNLKPSMVMLGDCTLKQAGELKDALPEGVISVCDVPFLDVRGAWMVRDLGFSALIAGKSMMDVCIRDRVPPTAIIKAVLSKGSVKYGLGMQKGRLEGSKEFLGSLAM